MARQLATLPENEGVLFIEEPLLPTFAAEFADFARSASVPIAAGECLYSRHDEGGALDIAQPDISCRLDEL
ncbi:hypothetical protein PAXRUDRAFT_823328 [Paxillus rubicundulus Ve08.2h10]|uniref:Enolase C-terminal domain-containing protein n=1 Tax=Paxillus rubicundulus Ve08.2h10 TaxID=930991 RepID=A0A0D0E3U9_9AGAM|nr:hypothetical protein PAXRUDRAFT_823328 [Paxillus rubicundulus Ve08.2h10]